MYTLESLKLLNTSFDSEHRLEQSDVEIVNRCVKLIERTRREMPCPGDNIEYTDEYGDYNKNTHILSLDNETGRLSARIRPYAPCVCSKGDKNEVSFYPISGGRLASVNPAALTYISKQEKLLMVFGHCGVTGNGGVYFKTMVNSWEYISPDKKCPGYSTKDWEKQTITYADNSSIYRYNDGQYTAFKDAVELQLWKNTYRAVEFPGTSPNQRTLFLYRENDKLVSRKEWDTLGLPLDTRFVNGIYRLIHVKVAYDDIAHMITTYRFTNSGYLDAQKFGPYERAKGTELVTPGLEIKAG